LGDDVRHSGATREKHRPLQRIDIQVVGRTNSRAVVKLACDSHFDRLSSELIRREVNIQGSIFGPEAVEPMADVIDERAYKLTAKAVMNEYRNDSAMTGARRCSLETLRRRIGPKMWLNLSAKFMESVEKRV